jgi:hypothetical protein
MILLLYALNVLAYVALQAHSPATASRIVSTTARRARVRLDVDGARRALFRLRGGTCLSRSLAIASLLPDAEVVIGVRPSEEGGVPSAGIHAHAWVEVNARPLRDSDVVGREIARMKPSPGNVLS